MEPLKLHEERPVRTWLFRIASLAAVFALIAGISLVLRRGDSNLAIGLVFLAPPVAVAFAWCWTPSVFAPFEWAKRYIDGAEGEHRHEWYSFRGQRVRVFLDEKQQPWFALNEIAFILSVEDEAHSFRHYAAHEYGIPESASEPCLSGIGLRRLIKYSKHPDAGALGIWLERDVLRTLRKRIEREASTIPRPGSGI